ncbi:GGDEF domain-containing protein [Blastococcus brunescens]|uniref:GGDEF domain-containing protein n=1 Tax=Blastococcus brunescens TaxID=1564165 RepID=A0ABZ1B1W2_9ACTN|nr:GGDEF domain-containing protein [Blastococcus sp. BMG 8361]WRL63736.1 GGDEF domain-containing protein [Blastococcus sp. BMG 8361]
MIDGTDALPSADRGSAFANAPMGIALTTPDGVVVDANPALCAMLGRTAEQVHGRSYLSCVHPDVTASAQVAHASLRATPTLPMRHESRLIRQDGTDVPVQVTASYVMATPEGQADHLVVIVEDITERKVLEAQLVHRSLHDPLTGLPNRLLFQDRLWHALERGRRENTPTCVLITDLDGFKAINDELGHPMGDLVLVTFAERLRSVLRASDTAARLGGDEFSIVCENTEPPDADVLAERLRAQVTEPLRLDGTTVSVGLSIGIGSVAGGDHPGTSTSGSSARPTTRCTPTSTADVRRARRSDRPGDRSPPTRVPAVGRPGPPSPRATAGRARRRPACRSGRRRPAWPRRRRRRGPAPRPTRALPGAAGPPGAGP